MAAEARRYPRTVAMEDRFAGLLPDVLITIGVDEFANLAAGALAPREEPQLGLTHMHAPLVSVRDEAALLVDRLRRLRTSSFRALTADSPDTLTTVARFLALLELYREGVVAFDQLAALGELSVRWTGTDEGAIEVGDEYDAEDRPDGVPVEPAASPVEHREQSDQLREPAADDPQEGR
jgi:segregation and condensation protein A